MKTLSATAEPNLRANANISRELASDGDIIAVSESAKRQIGAQASEGKAHTLMPSPFDQAPFVRSPPPFLRAPPPFFEGP